MVMPALKNPVAYYCAEFGTDSNLPTYAGGLGILAGDTMLEAGEQNFAMVGVGLLYQGKNFMQRFTTDGWQYEEASSFQRDSTATIRLVEEYGKPVDVTFRCIGEEVKVRAYQQRLGDKTILYLLTTDVAPNSEHWRNTLAADYCCGDEDQLKQQMILGIGGARMLERLRIKPSVHHFQEGRPIFAHWEIANRLSKEKKLDFEDALREVSSNIVYTNHTLVPDGNLVYDTNLVRRYATDLADEYGIETNALIEPGVVANDRTRFSITQYGLNVSRIASSVSEPHLGQVRKVWPDYKWVNVTNGVHIPRWRAWEFNNPGITEAELWAAHIEQKKSLAREVMGRCGFEYDPHRLILGWARRISGYKQLGALFHDLNRFKLILTDTSRPVHLLVAGKSHHGDDWGKRHIQEVMRYMSSELNSHALFVPNYDIALARQMVRGVDVWLNTPEQGKEASGTSGMKALTNGVLNCTVADGWAGEVNWEEIGWTLDPHDISSSLYGTLENEVVPLYYEQDDAGIPIAWVEMMKKSIKLSEKYSTERMLREYDQRLYLS
jgi:glucan phosphorylase